jgi:hypothetical protein
MENEMSELQMLPGNAMQHPEVADAKPKKKASWLRTILWMLSMMLLVNVVMAIVAYFLFFADK